MTDTIELITACVLLIATIIGVTANRRRDR